MGIRLDQLIKGIAITDRRGRFEQDIGGIKSDSRAVREGDVFVAIRGVSTDGHQYIKTALEKGAHSVIGEVWPEEADNGSKPNVVLVPNSRRALALVSANFYSQPSRKLHVAGVTGTNGKTTVSYLLESIIRAASKRVGVIGSVDCRFAGHSESLGHTTPDAIVLQQKMAEMASAGVTHVVMEVSSHALDQERVTGVHFKVCGFTNLTQDHLDYHKSIETYFRAKARLFSEVLRKSRARGRMAVVNIDDPRGNSILEAWGGKSLSVSLDPQTDADVLALETEYSLDGIKATVRTSKGVWEIESALIGQHNLSNILVAIGMALAMGFSKARIMRGLGALDHVPGRLERVPHENKAVFVDYAHTPDALKNTLAALRPLSKNKLIVVFGCGGDRDKEKRGPMGKAVAEHADFAFVTNDNPRSEDPASIAAAVEEGLKEGGFSAADSGMPAKKYRVVLDRQTAIRTAIDTMEAGDVLIIAGKGHENYQVIGRKKLSFDDREAARRALAGLPAPPPVPMDGTGDLAPELTTEVDSSQVIEAEIVEAVTVSDNSAPPVTESIDAEAIVESVDLEPDIVGESADLSGGSVVETISEPPKELVSEPPTEVTGDIVEIVEVVEDAEEAPLVKPVEAAPNGGADSAKAPEDAAPVEAKAEEAKAEEPKSEAPKADEPKAEEPKAEEAKTEEPKESKEPS